MALRVSAPGGADSPRRAGIQWDRLDTAPGFGRAQEVRVVKRSLLVGALGGLLAFGVATGSVNAQAKKTTGGHVSATAPGAQPSGPEAAPAVPTGELALGTVRLTKAV